MFRETKEKIIIITNYVFLFSSHKGFVENKMDEKN
jgi:hypothetical protein